jgi:hypothetical protein
MLDESKQILILLIVINLGLCSYYFLLYKDAKQKKLEDSYLLELDKKFTEKYENENVNLDSSCNKEEPSSLCNPFHDKFFNNNNYLGWRRFYLKNQNHQEVEPTYNFEGIITRNYLDSMKNVQNEVTPPQYQIR